MQYVTIAVPYVILSYTVTEDHEIGKHVITPFGRMDISVTRNERGDIRASSESVMRVETELSTDTYDNPLAFESFIKAIFALSYEVAVKELGINIPENIRIELILLTSKRCVHVWRQSGSHSWKFEANEIPTD
jgi:hypothetical protein